MMTKTSLPVVLLTALAFATAGCDSAGSRGPSKERWATTENTNVELDFDKVNEAYKTAEGPEDFERRVNEIYQGSEVISVAVQDLDAKTQVVTGFFDKNSDGTVQDPEKVFTIRRDVSGEGAAQIQTSGFGHYAYYSSPVMSLASGMLLGAMVSSALRPNYVPVYTQPYTTPPNRAPDLRSHRDTYRASNPSGVDHSKSSQTGRRYNNVGSSRFGSGKSGAGSRFGVRRGERGRRPERLVA
ncbi:MULTISPECIES: hypothetical protein [Sorangium]|uniref:Secreted protein n=1 Tax=Sorangium cellulosum TaxID=56 RepID=A0A4P2R5D2_SORCE|nr:MULTISPECIES: hypothetical protein [Sorangium]AUX37861.1 secreted protein [Sorangium cellulosum]WCQ97151.1 hypothetical protein NQZ70_09942 [Sorangium sp. Soce836]